MQRNTIPTRLLIVFVLVINLNFVCTIGYGTNGPGTVTDPNQPIIRISAASLKNFGDAKANDPPRLEFIADRIAEQAVHGICVVDELQDVDGSAFVLLEQAVSDSAGRVIEMELSARVGSTRKEQYGFFWDPNVASIIGSVTIHDSPIIERDPALATFKATAGFDFTLCAFHTRPDSDAQALKKELRHLDDLFAEIQELSDARMVLSFWVILMLPPM